MITLKIKKLFGIFNYEINLKDDGITILTGPNGFGKTTILKCLEALTSIEKIRYFYKLYFSEISITINDNVFCIIKNGNDLFMKYNKNDKCNIHDIYEYHNYINNNIYNSIYNNSIYNSICNNELIDPSIAVSLLRRNDFIRLSNINENGSKKIKKQYNSFNDMMKIISNKIGNLYYIKEDRLINNKNTNSIIYKNGNNNDESIYTIDKIPITLKNIINDYVNKYYNNSNKLDSTYPSRLINHNKDEEIKEDEFYDRKNDMKKKQNILYKYNLFTKNNGADFEFNQKYASALKVYFDDFDKKYSVYESLITKLDLFTNIINNKLYNKKVQISKDYGIKVMCTYTEKEIPLNELSSGEKHEIILFFELIFSVEQSITILIDEPELSLHVAWQKNFINDLLNIINQLNKKMNIIIATHSPYIINKYEKYQIDLGELYKNDKR